jgi:DNA excision repair protein ERCC-4
MLPSYLAEAFGDLYEEDGLAVFAKGLQWEFLLAAFCRFYADVEEGHMAVLEEKPQIDEAKGLRDDTVSNKGSKKPPLVLVLGLKDDTERSTLVEILQSWGTPTSMLPMMITNESGQAKERTHLYEQGGILVITSRILIVDLLAGTIQASEIDGMLIAHADQVTEQSTEAFIIRIFQSQRKEPGFIKAFTDTPDALVSGFAKVDKILKALHVRKLYLYPRFHSDIRDELEQENAIRVTEYHQELSKRQKEIQNAIAVLVLQCLRELKQATEHLVSWSSVTNSDISVENCVTQQFDRAVSRQLEPYWHQLHTSSKQLVQDLRTLRTLFHALLQYDCVSFWKLLNSIRTMSAASRHPSMWLLEPAADTLFKKAKERVYFIQRPLPTSKIPNPIAELVTVLEENPKWKLLKSVLQEIREQDEGKEDVSRDGPANILVMVKDDKTLETLRFFLAEQTEGKKTRTLQKRWLRYLEQSNDRSRSITNSRGDTLSISEESRLLLEEEGRCRRLLKDSYHQERQFKSANKKKLNEIPAYMRKRRRVAAEKGRGDLTGDDLERQAILDDAVEEAKHEIEVATFDGSECKRSGDKAEMNEEQDLYRVTFPDRELRVVLKIYSDVEGGRSHLLLQDLCPDYVVLYDVEVEFIRGVEIYAALSEGRNDPIRVFFLIFEASAEEKSFKKLLEREQSAFERLIHHKKTMPPPSLHTLESQEMQQATGSEGTYIGGSLPLSIDTRTGKGKLNTSNQRRDIAVDVREFRSALPSILHQGKFVSLHHFVL